MILRSKVRIVVAVDVKRVDRTCVFMRWDFPRAH